MDTPRYHIPSITGQDWHKPDCFGCGPLNPHGLHADFRFHEETGEVRFSYTSRSHQEGAPGYVHGGVLASLLDEAQGVLCFHVGHAVMTDELSMKYHVATPLNSSFHVRCWLTAVRRKRLYTRATIQNDEGVTLVSSRAVWYVLSERLMRRMFKDQFPPDEQVRIHSILEVNRKRAKGIRKRLRRERESASAAERQEEE